MVATLPSPPSSLAAVLDAASNPNVPLEKLARAVQADPAFSAMVLRVVNTAKYASNRGPITNLRMASMRLGVRALRNLAVCHAAQSVVSAKQLKGFDLQGFWEHSLQRAVAAEMLAERVPDLDPNEAFTAGLLLDLGVLAIVLQDTTRQGHYVNWKELDREQALAQEAERLGTTRAEVVRRLVAQWKLPDELGVPVAWAHAPDQAPAPLQPMCGLLTAADAVARALYRADTGDALQDARTALDQQLGWPDSSLEDILDPLGERVAEAARTMGFKVGAQPTLDTLLQAANRSLVDINLSYEDLVQKLEQTIAEKQRLAEELDVRNRELERISRTDALTGLPNRRVLFGDARTCVARAARYGTSMCVIVGDIDHFKKFNDTYGHVFGDEVLKAVAHCLQDAVRTADLAARTGGEEFALLLPDTDLAGARVVAERARRTIEDMRMESPSGKTVSVTMSFGLAMLGGPATTGADEEKMVTRIYQAADELLYEAKEGGRNCVAVRTRPVAWSRTLQSSVPRSIAV